MSKEIENQVSEILKNAGVVYSAVTEGVSKNPFGGAHAMDQWACKFTRESSERSEKFDYFTGIGLRAPATMDQKIRASMAFQGLTESDKKGLTPYGRRYLARVEDMRKPVAPSAASVLYSLLLDASASSQSFESWCSEFEYESDSRKAYATYKACQKNADKLNRVIPHAVQSALSEALQDY